MKILKRSLLGKTHSIIRRIANSSTNGCDALVEIYEMYVINKD